MNITEPTSETKIKFWQFQLIKEYHQINCAYELNLIRPQIKVVDVQSYFGQWDPLHRELKISSHLIQNYQWKIVIEILRHEIAHQLVTDRGHNELGHGPIFKSYCLQLGLDERFQKSQANINLNSIDFSTTQKKMTNNPDDRESERLLEKVEKLLSLAQSNNQNEALAAMEKVNELYEKYNLSQINGNNKTKQFTFIIIDLKSSKFKAHYSIISTILMEHYFVDVIFSFLYDPQTFKINKAIEILGAPENVRMAEYVFHYLEHIIEDLWKDHSHLHQLKAVYKRSFQLGLLHGFRSALKQSRDVRNNSHQNVTFAHQNKSNALIKNSEDRDFHIFKQSRYPSLRKKTNNAGRVHDSIFSQGIEDGKKIVISKGIENTSQHKSLLLELKN